MASLLTIMHPHTKKFVNYICFDIKETEGLQVWFKVKPSGIWHISIGIDNYTENGNYLAAFAELSLLSCVGNTHEEMRASREWFKQKVEQKECIIEFRDRTPLIPSGSAEVREVISHLGISGE